MAPRGGIPSGPVQVADACSGFSTMYAALTLSLILAYRLRSTFRRLIVIPAAWVLAIICNTARVTLLVYMIEWYGVSILDSYAHEMTGIVAFIGTIILLFLVAGREALRPATAAS